MVQAILAILSEVLKMLGLKQEKELKQIDLKNTEEMKRVAEAQRDNELKDRAEGLVKDISDDKENKEKSLEEIRRLTAS